MMEGMDGFSAGWGRRRYPDDVRSVAVGLAVRIEEEAAVAGRSGSRRRPVPRFRQSV
jgi:hypothetical protein